MKKIIEIEACFECPKLRGLYSWKCKKSNKNIEHIVTIPDWCPLEDAPLPERKIVTGRDGKVWKMPPSPDRAKLRSKTYRGIAAAMANQWGALILFIMLLVTSCTKPEPIAPETIEVNQKIAYRHEMQEQKDTMYFIFELPKSYKKGTQIESHIYFVNKNGYYKRRKFFDYRIEQPTFSDKLFNTRKTLVYIKIPKENAFNSVDVCYQTNAR